MSHRNWGDTFVSFLGFAVFGLFIFAIVQIIRWEMNEVCVKEVAKEVNCVGRGGLGGGVECRIRTKNYLVTKTHMVMKGETIEICGHWDD